MEWAWRHNNTFQTQRGCTISMQSQRRLTGDSNCSTHERNGVASKSSQLSSLFSTMLESNAMLREDIDQMQAKEFCMTSSVSQQLSRTMNSTVSHKERSPSVPLESRQPLSQSLPPRLLNTSALSTSYESSSSLESTDTSSQGSPNQQQNKTGVHTGSSVSANSDSECTEGEDESVGPVQTLHNDHCPQTMLPLPVKSLSITSISSTELSFGNQSDLENDPFASPGGSTIQSMWDNFSVEEYAQHKEKRVKVHVSKPVQKTWNHQITIPEPFKMTIRERAIPRKKSRALIVAEQEKLEKKMQEDLECEKKFRALPVPATTYIPIDELKKEENKRQTQNGHDRIVHSIKPFSFMKREEEKQRQKCEHQAVNNCQTLFKAKPVPHDILSPRVSEELKEKEEYRKILIRVRSHEMLARAELPRSMHRQYAVRKHSRERLGNGENVAFLTDEHTFHPSIKPAVPDHDQAIFSVSTPIGCE